MDTQSGIDMENSTKPGQHDMSLYILLREQRLRRLAAEMGYPSLHLMLCELYLNRGYGIPALAKLLRLAIVTVRRLLIEHDIPVRQQGGSNHVKVVMTPALYQEICRDGVPSVAERLGVHHTTLRWQLDRYRVLRKAAQPPPPPQAKASPVQEAPKTQPVPPPDLYVRGHLITEHDVEKCLRSGGDEIWARYQRGELSKLEAYEMTRTWLRQVMQFGLHR